MPSLFSGVTGLQNHQTKMDIIGNNIANVNTVGFKKSRVNFSDMMSNKKSSAQSPVDGGTGGVNPIQVGLGSKISSINKIFTPGASQSTGRNSDLKINGEGMFILGDGRVDYYTKAGDFGLDALGHLVGSNGMHVQGWQATKKADGTTEIEAGAKVGPINIQLGDTLPAKATTRTEYSGNLNASGGLENLRINVDADGTGGNDEKVDVDIAFDYDALNDRWNWTASNPDANSTITIEGSGYFDLYSDGTIKESHTNNSIKNTAGGGTVLLDVPTTGMIRFKEKSNAGNSVTSQFTKNVTVTSNKIYDSTGKQHTLSMEYTKSDENIWSWEASNPEGLPVTNGTGFITFDAYGQIGGDYMFATTSSTDLTKFGTILDAEGTAKNSYPTTTDLGVSFDTSDKLMYYIPDGLKNSNGQYIDTSGAVLTDQTDATLRVFGDSASPYSITETGIVKYRGSLYDSAITLSAKPEEGEIMNKSHFGSFSFDPANEGGGLPPDEGAAKIILQPDFNNVTQFAEDYGITLKSQDGYGMGELENFTFSETGDIIGEYSNNEKQILGRIAIAKFFNNGGLESAGDSLFLKTSNSGEAQILQPGSGGLGTIESGSLEMSNVDLAKEFTEMIIAQRGFQANSKTISTADQLLQELINLKR